MCFSVIHAVKGCKCALEACLSEDGIFVRDKNAAEASLSAACLSRCNVTPAKNFRSAIAKKKKKKINK